MIYAFTNSKGGVGKSTLSVHLAAWIRERGGSVALIDADVQGSSSAWLHEASPDIPVFRLPTADDILEGIHGIRGQFDDVVVDGPAGLSEVSRTILFVADMTCLPCGPSVLDLRAAQDAIRVVRQAQAIRHGPPRAVLIPNKLQVQYRLSRELLDAARTVGIPSASALRLRQAYADAVGQGSVVWRMGPSAAAAASEIRNLFEELIEDEWGTKAKHEPSIANN